MLNLLVAVILAERKSVEDVMDACLGYPDSFACLALYNTASDRLAALTIELEQVTR
jgi:hypothetical protein